FVTSFFVCRVCVFFFFFQAEDGIRDSSVTGVQTCALPILILPPTGRGRSSGAERPRPVGGRIMRTMLPLGVAAVACALAMTAAYATHPRMPPGHHEVPPDRCPLIGSRPDGRPPRPVERLLNPKKNRRTAPAPQDMDSGGAPPVP